MVHPRVADPDLAHLYLFENDDLVRVTTSEPPHGTAPTLVPEAVVQDLWRLQAIRHSSLRTTGGTPLTILDPGRLNTADGPDFTAAHVRIGSDEWRGDIEVHTSSAEWARHGHPADPRYNAVVLHVTLNADLMTGTLRRPDGTLLPELILAPHLTRRLHDHVLHFFERPAELPCSWTLDRTDPHDRASWVRTMAQRRLLRKSREAEALGPNALDILSARTLGAPTNADALGTLATRLSPDELRRMLPLARERAALIAADLLSPSDVLETAIELSAAERLSTPWRYGGVRPAGTPDLRIVQWASLYSPGRMLGYGGRQHALERVAERDGSALIQAVSGQPTDYWHTHYRIGRVSKPHSPDIGASVCERLIANAVLPVALATGADIDDALACLDALRPESDAYTRRFPSAFIRQRTATHTQGLHELHRRYCGPGHCLSCAVGKVALGM